jgi:hypothetical protein
MVVSSILASCGGDTQPPTVPPPAVAPPEVTPPPVSKGQRLPPIDEASKDPSLVKFRDELLQAVTRRDVTPVLAILDPSIRNSFGGDGGIQEFKTMWKPESADSELWDVLRFILMHGGAFQGGTFVAPYVFSSFPKDLPDDDSFRYGAVVEDNVILHSKPDAKASGVATLSYHVVKQLDEDGLPSGWIKVATTDGTEGYIPESLYRNVVEYRAIFAKKNGAWRMTMLLAGD